MEGSCGLREIAPDVLWKVAVEPPGDHVQEPSCASGHFSRS